MIPGKLPPQAPSHHDQELLRGLTVELLGQHLPTYKERDVSGAQYRAALLFKQDLRDAIRDSIRLDDRRSVQVNLYITPHYRPNHWYVEIRYDTKTRGIEQTVLVPINKEP